jgi:hypothetical protein
MCSRPNFVENDLALLPTKADFALLRMRRIEAAVNAAISISSQSSGAEFLRTIGLESLITALVDPPNNLPADIRSLSIKSICQLVKAQNSVGDLLAVNGKVLDVLCDCIEAPYRGFKSFKSASGKNLELQTQKEAVGLVLRILRSSEVAAPELMSNNRLRKVLTQVLTVSASASLNSSNDFDVLVEKFLRKDYPPLKVNNKNPQTKAANDANLKMLENRRVLGIGDLHLSQMARISLMGLGGIPWKPKQPNQKGIRILSFDGGGTKGVMSLAILAEVMKRANKSRPSLVFGMIILHV